MFNLYARFVAEVAITELSKATGFPSSALRYYERIGLLSPVGRSPGGYRLYDERAVERLTFIARAKRLGQPRRDHGSRRFVGGRSVRASASAIAGAGR